MVFITTNPNQTSSKQDTYFNSTQTSNYHSKLKTQQKNPLSKVFSQSLYGSLNKFKQIQARKYENRYFNGSSFNSYQNSHENSFYNKDLQQFRSNLVKQISNREKLSKLQSKSHVNNKNQLLKKKVQKSKEMNKKVKQVMDRNYKSKRQKLNKFKIQTIFEPEMVQQFKKQRGKTMQNYYSKTQALRNKNDQLQLQNIGSIQRLRSNYNQAEMFAHCDVSVLKSLKQILQQDLRTSHSLKNVIYEKHTFSMKKPYQQKNIFKGKFSYNYSPYRNYSKSPSPSSKNLDQKIKEIKQRKQQIQRQKQSKVISLTIKKHLKTSQISKRNTHKNFQNQNQKQNSNQHSRHNSISPLNQSSTPSKRFKKIVISKQQLQEKQQRIFKDIMKKTINKELFLKERVNNVKNKLKKQEQQRKNHLNSWEQQRTKTQNMSFAQSQHYRKFNKGLLVKKQLQNKKSRDINNQNSQRHQQAIRKTHQKLMEQSKKNQEFKKLCNYSLTGLKKKLQQVQKIQQQNFQRSGFF